MWDIIQPKGTIDEFVVVAKQLGLKGLVILGKPITQFPSIQAIWVDRLQVRSDPGVVRIGPPNLELFKSLDIVAHAELDPAKDGLHQRKSGLNHVLVRQAAKSNAAVALNLGALRGRNAPQIMGRHAQNAKLCVKAHCEIVPATFATEPWQLRGEVDVAAYLQLLGLDGTHIRQALSFFENHTLQTQQNPFRHKL